MNQHYKELVKASIDAYSKPFIRVSQEDWTYMIDHVFLGDTHKVAKGVVMRVYGPEFAGALILSCAYTWSFLYISHRANMTLLGINGF
ncbi:unnamed protein product [Camellia sinensis]